MFAQPWAWLGLLGLAVPVVIHLLARHHAVRTRVPTVRFIEAADVTFVSLRTLTDVPLLVVRLAIVTAAVAAIAGPRWSGTTATARGRAIAVVVDTSQSIAGDEGPAAARAAVARAAVSTVVSTTSLPDGIASASRWLAAQSGTRELVVVSDFQRGSLTSAAFAPVPDGAAITLTPLRRVPVALPEGFELHGDRSRMSWPPDTSSTTRTLTMLAGPAQARADALLEAVAAVSQPSSSTANARRAVLVFADAPERAAVLAAPAIDQPWMFDVLQPLLADTALARHVSPRAWQGALALVIDDEPESPTAAAVAATVYAALVQPLPWAEFEPETITPEQRRSWERPATDVPDTRSAPQGRWLWVVVLVLLAVEWWMRRARPSTARTEVPRVA